MACNRCSECPRLSGPAPVQHGHRWSARAQPAAQLRSRASINAEASTTTTIISADHGWRGAHQCRGAHEPMHRERTCPRKSGTMIPICTDTLRVDREGSVGSAEGAAEPLRSCCPAGAQAGWQNNPGRGSGAISLPELARILEAQSSCAWLSTQPGSGSRCRSAQRCNRRGKPPIHGEGCRAAARNQERGPIRP